MSHWRNSSKKSNSLKILSIKREPNSFVRYVFVFFFWFGFYCCFRFNASLVWNRIEIWNRKIAGCPWIGHQFRRGDKQLFDIGGESNGKWIGTLWTIGECIQVRGCGRLQSNRQSNGNFFFLCSNENQISQFWETISITFLSFCSSNFRTDCGPVSLRAFCSFCQQ